MSICNFRCHYCYLSHRSEQYQGMQPKMRYTPDDFAKAFSLNRMGGACYMNFCAEGETLLTKDIDLYVHALVKIGHYAEIVTNLTVTKVLEKILLWDKDLLKRVEFKCSFHYLELKKKRLLNVFAENVHKIWDAGASANIEITPSDELIPYIDEVKEFSMKEFGALPHLTIARDDRTRGIEYLTSLSIEEYDSIWSTFDSAFWRFKKSIFGKKQNDYCYAGAWSVFVDFATGEASACYGKVKIGNVIANPNKSFPQCAIGKCPIAHCYNGHALLSMGLIPNLNDVHYGDIRDRVTIDGRHWLQPELKDFFNCKLQESNTQWSAAKKMYNDLCILQGKVLRKTYRMMKKS